MTTFPSVEIPNKSMFKVDEVCSITGIRPYVLRFWETEFECITPATSSTGQKLYEHRDIEVIALIKKLLFDDKMSVERAKVEVRKALDPASQELPELPSEGAKSAPLSISRTLRASDIEKLEEAKALLKDLLSEIQDRRILKN